MADINKGGNVREKAQDTLSSARQTAQEAKSTLQEAASAAGHKTQDIASNVTRKAQDLASNVGHRAQDLASTAADKAEDALSSVGQGMSSLAGTIREKAPHEGMMGTAAGAVADRFQSGGRYLQEHDLRAMSQDVGALIRQYPFASLLVALGVGCLIGMVSRR
jgi:ElaB/YqjD/DUF883 family membrane-anchored ribosome-binding protein